MGNDNFEEKAREFKMPIQYKIYKGVKGKLGAIRINFKRPYTNPDPKKKEGIVFIEMVPAIAPNVYDWENQKMIMALSLADIPKIILYLRNPKHQVFKNKNKLMLLHDRGAGTHLKGNHLTTLEVSKDDNMDSFMFAMYQNVNDNKKSARVTVSPAEAIVIGTLLQSAIPAMLSWD
jgi:hypothetical protein